MILKKLGFGFVSLICAAASSAHAKPGFFKMDDVEIPAAVRTASKAVFKGFVFYGKPQLTLKPQKYNWGLQVLSDNKAKTKDPLLIENIDKQIEILQRCKEQKLKTCETGFPNMDSGSFFVSGDSSTLMTARHVIEDAVGVEQERLCEMRKTGIRIRIILMDVEGKLVLDSVNGPATTLLRAAGNPNLVQCAPEVPDLQLLGPDAAFTTDDATNDFAVIQMSSALPVTPLVFAKDTKVNKDSFFVLGYPSATTNREKNSDGKSLYATIGVESKIAPPMTDANGAQVSYDPELGKKFIEAHSANALVLDSDLNHGISGGPVLDPDGEVQGIVVIGFKQNAAIDLDASVPQSVWAVRPFAINGVRGVLEDFLISACD